jgi:hypothetical protein
MSLSQRRTRRPGPSRARGVAARIECEPLEHRTLFSGTDAGAIDAATAVDGTTTVDTAIDAAAATNTNNGNHFHLPKFHKGFP